MIDFGQEINLVSFYEKYKNDYKIRLPEIYQFPAAVVEMGIMTSLVFSNGKCVCVGINQEKTKIMGADGNLILTPIVEKISTMMGNFWGSHPSPKYEVVNIVFQMDMRRNINLTELHITQPNCVYEPETFPALILRTNDPRHTFLVFSNGKIIAHFPHPRLDNGNFLKTTEAMKQAMTTALENALIKRDV